MKRIIIYVILAGVILAACFPAPSADVTGVWRLVSYGAMKVLLYNLFRKLLMLYASNVVL